MQTGNCFFDIYETVKQL